MEESLRGEETRRWLSAFLIPETTPKNWIVTRRKIFHIPSIPSFSITMNESRKCYFIESPAAISPRKSKDPRVSTCPEFGIKRAAGARIESTFITIEKRYPWCSWLSRPPNTRKVPSSILGCCTFVLSWLSDDTIAY